MTKPVLVFGYGNPSRGDDALGPLALNYIEANISSERIEVLSDFQLQVEHALDLSNRSLILFIDASVAGESAFAFTELQPVKDTSYSTHAVSPAAILSVYQEIIQQSPPPSFLLSIKGQAFELGEGLSPNAEANLIQANRFAWRLLHNPDVKFWREYVTYA